MIRLTTATIIALAFAGLCFGAWLHIRLTQPTFKPSPIHHQRIETDGDIYAFHHVHYNKII
jgi:hypothetical protein